MVSTPMKIAVIPPHEDLLDNELFGLSYDYDLRNNQGVDRIGFNKLHEICNSNGHDIDTIDRTDITDIDACLFVDPHHGYLKKLKSLDNTPILVYMMREPPSFVPQNNIRQFLSYSELFNSSLTWDESISRLDDCYYKYRWPQRTDLRTDESAPFEEKNLLTNVSSRKYSSHPNELYSAREDIIKYFDKNYPDEFEFYGLGWNEKFDFFERYQFGKPARENYMAYRGEISDKLSAYFENKFALCFENMTGVDGWITEKIFDCYRAGIVPVYWGASNIADKLPEDSFVDYRRFRNPKALHDYLQSIKEDDYKQMVEAGEEYLRSSCSEKYSPDDFAENIYRCLMDANQFDQVKLEEIPSYDNELRSWIESLGATKRGRHVGIPPENITKTQKLANIIRLAKRNPKTLFNQPEAIAAALGF